MQGNQKNNIMTNIFHYIITNVSMTMTMIHTTTLKVESFVGRKFRDFAIFFADRESLYPPNRTFIKIREILLEKTPKMVLK